MKTAFTPWSDLMLGQATPLQRAAWFVLGSVEREQWLNLDALTSYWLRAPMAWSLTSYWLRAPMAWWAPSRPARQHDPVGARSTAAGSTPRRRAPVRAMRGARPSATVLRHTHHGRHVERAIATRDAAGKRGQPAMTAGV